MLLELNSSLVHYQIPNLAITYTVRLSLLRTLFILSLTESKDEQTMQCYRSLESYRTVISCFNEISEIFLQATILYSGTYCSRLSFDSVNPFTPTTKRQVTQSLLTFDPMGRPLKSDHSLESQRAVLSGVEGISFLHCNILIPVYVYIYACSVFASSIRQFTTMNHAITWKKFT